MPGITDILAPGGAVSKLELRRYLAAREIVTPADYGGVEGGVVDCAPAFAAALAAHQAVLVPEGVWRIAAPIVLGHGQSLFGVGDGSVIQARDDAFDPNALPSYPSTFNAIELQAGYATVRDLKIVGGSAALKLYGRSAPCVKNVIENLTLWDAEIGIVLDGYDSPDRPCYWNAIARVLIARPRLHGVLFTVESAGDTPNANKLHDVRVYSLSAPMTGCGFFLSAARFHNSFLDCEANLHPSAEACFRLGYATDENRIINFYAECLGAVPGIRIDNGSQNTTILNLFSATGGAPIWDTTGARKYQALNAGHPLKHDLGPARIADLKLEGLTVETEFVDLATGGTYDPDLTRCTTFLVSAFGGAVTFRLPAASGAAGRKLTVKKTDLSTNPVTITEAGGLGPDGQPLVLGNRFDHAELVSNGAAWWITAARRAPLDTRFVETPGLFQPDLAQQFYGISAYAGAVEVRLPPPGAAHAAGRQVTIKKTDAGGSPVTVSCEGSTTGPDGRVWSLRAQYDSLEVVSNGASWFVTAHLANAGDVEYLEGQSLITGKAGRSFYGISAYAGPVEFRLPEADRPEAVGKPMTIKKVDAGDHKVTVTTESGPGPEGRPVTLYGPGDYVTVVANGAGWFIIGATSLIHSPQFVENTGFFWIAPDRPFVLVSAWNGPVQAHLPNPAAPDSVGRQVTIKKIDGQPNVVTVTAESVSGPDGSAVELRKFGDYVSILSNGAGWHEVAGRYDTPVTGWANPDGSGFNRGVFNSDEISNVGFTYDRDVLNAINYRLFGTRDVLRALILDLKSKGVLGD